MALESANYISGLNSSNPAADDPISQGDDHIRTLKKVLLQSFPDVDGPVAPPQAPTSANSTIRSDGSNWVESAGVTITSSNELSASKVSSGDVDAAGTVSANKVTAPNYEGGNMSLTGNISANKYFGDGSSLSNLPSGYSGWKVNGNQVNSGDNVEFRGAGATTVSVSGRTVTISSTDNVGDGGGPSYSAGNGISINNTVIQMSGSYNGSFTASGNITAYSDDRLKTRLGEVEDALSKVKQIETFRYVANEDGEKLGMGVSEQMGVSAQQLQSIAPEAVHETETGHLSVDYSRLVVLCIEAIKQLEAR